MCSHVKNIRFRQRDDSTIRITHQVKGGLSGASRTERRLMPQNIGGQECWTAAELADQTARDHAAQMAAQRAKGH